MDVETDCSYITYQQFCPSYSNQIIIKYTTQGAFISELDYFY